MKRIVGIIAAMILTGGLLFHPGLPLAAHLKPKIKDTLRLSWLPSYQLYLIHGEDPNKHSRTDCDKFVVTNSKGQPRLVSRIADGQFFATVRLVFVEKDKRLGIYFHQSPKQASMPAAYGLVTSRQQP